MVDPIHLAARVGGNDMDKEAIFRGDFLYRRENVAWAGNCSLYDEYLWFRPDALDRLAGAHPWRLPLQEITDLDVAGRDCKLCLKTAERSFVLEGAPTLELHRVLRQALAQIENKNNALVPADRDARVFYHGELSLALAGGKPVTGEVALSPKSLRFVPRGGRRTGETNAEIVIYLADIQHFEFRRDESILFLQMETNELEVSGANTAVLAEVLNFLRSQRSQSLQSSLAHRVRWFTGEHASFGQLVITPRRIRFVSEDEALVDVGDGADVELPAGRISGLYADPKTLTVRSAAGFHYFEISEAATLLDQLAATWANQPNPLEPQLDDQGQFADEAAIQRLALTWSWVIEAELLNQPLVAGPVLLHIPGVRLERHFLLLTEQAFLLLPMEGPTTEGGAIVFRNIGGLDPSAPELRRDRLEFQIGGHNVQLLPRGGAAFVSLFWDSIPRRIASPPESEKVVRRKRRALTEYDDNRRESYRVSPVERHVGTITILALPEEHVSEFEYETLPPEDADTTRRVLRVGDQLQYEMRDVSVEGMGVVMQEPLPSGATVEVDLFDNDSVFSVQAEVVNTRALASKKHPFHSGLRVEEPEGETRIRVQGLWTSMQRERAARRAAP